MSFSWKRHILYSIFFALVLYSTVNSDFYCSFELFVPLLKYSTLIDFYPTIIEANETSAAPVSSTWWLKKWRKYKKIQRNRSYCHTVGHIPEGCIDLSKLSDSIHSLWSTEHDKSRIGRWGGWWVYWCHHMYQSIVVSKVMWCLAGNWYPLRASFWSVN